VEDVLRVLKADRLIDAAPPAEDAGVPAAEPPVAAEAPLKLWGGARPLAGSPAERYLAARCLDSGSVELRFHPRTPHGPRPFTRFLPAMIAAVRDGAELVGVHRTFLDVRLSRVAALSHPKCGLGPFGQGAVRLGGTGPRLGLAEGIETALSASILFGIPCWATLGTERFARVTIPQEVTELVLCLDNDAGGRRAEVLARGAFPHVASIEPRYPPRAGADWNDVLRAGRRR
jgi:hypothetical protein